MPPRTPIVRTTVGQPVVLARPRLQQLLGAVWVIAHIPGRAVIPCGIASVSGKPPPSFGNRNEAEIAPLVGGVVAAALLQGFLVDVSPPTIEKVFAMLFRAGGALDAPALIGLALRLGVGAAAAVDRLDVLFRPGARLLDVIPILTVKFRELGISLPEVVRTWQYFCRDASKVLHCVRSWQTALRPTPKPFA